MNTDKSDARSLQSQARVALVRPRLQQLWSNF